MGFLRDLKKLSDQSAELQAAYPIEQRLATAQATMAAANESLAAVGHQARDGVIADGLPAVATIVSARQLGPLVNLNPLVELQLLVQVPGGVPIPVTRTEVVLQLHLARVQVGERLKVLVDHQDPQRLAIDWTAVV